VLVLVLVLGAKAAWAQACCAGASILSPTRLSTHEDALLGLQVRAGVGEGSVDGHGRFIANPAGAGEVDLDQTLSGTLRVFGAGQLSVAVPVVETSRWVTGLGEVGGGLGDVSLSYRHDFLLAGESLRFPGVALLGGLTFPTGRSAEQARLALGSDTTGAGVWQAALGVSLEQTWGSLFGNVSFLASQSLPRTVQGVTELLGPTLSLGGALGWVFDSGSALAGSLTAIGAPRASVNGASAAGTERLRFAAGFSGALPLSETWRLQGSLVTQLPLGLNEPVSTTFSLLLMRTWT
jgi:hypothetical protein